MKKRYQSIDALRGIAALMVMILHSGMHFLGIPSIQKNGDGLLEFFKYVDIGRVGITIFFLISGFVISKSIHTNKRQTLRAFAIKRFFRLYPLFWTSIVLALIFIWFPKSVSFSVQDILANITMLPSFLGSPFVMGLYWSLETELLFYILMASFFVFGRLADLKTLLMTTILLYIILALVMIFIGQDHLLPHWVATPYHLCLMLFGVTTRYFFDKDDLSLAFINKRYNMKQAFWLHLTLILIIPLAVIFLFILTGNLVNFSDATAYIFGLVLFLVGLYTWTKPSRFFVYTGTVSYSIYLMHPVIYHSLSTFVVKKGYFDTYHVWVYITITSIGTLLFAHATYHMIEKPAINFARKILRKDIKS